MELQVSLCGGRMIYKLGDVLITRRDNVFTAVASNPLAIAALGGIVNAQILIDEMLKPLNSPSDADYTLTFAGLGALIPSLQDPGFVQTLLMFFTLCSQLGIKKIIDEFCTSSRDAALFLRELAVIGMSLVGGDFQLSSTRSSCDALAFLDKINIRDDVNPVLNTFLQQFPRDTNRPTKSSLAEFDLVPKMLSGDYIKKIPSKDYTKYETLAPDGKNEISFQKSRHWRFTHDQYYNWHRAVTIMMMQLHGLYPKDPKTGEEIKYA
jgi:hypothetical protein